MHVLRPYVKRIEGLTTFISAAAENPVTQGVMLDVNPIWLAAYRMARAGLRPDAFDFRWWLWPALDELVGSDSIEGDLIDFDWTDSTGQVENLTRHLMADFEKPLPSYGLPFIVKAIARPVGAEDAESRAGLLALVREQNFFAIVETRPLGRLALNAGDVCVGSGLPGTIGGFLKDQNSGKVYAATCGHVVAQGVSVSSQGSHVGICSHSSPPIPMIAGQRCTQGCSNANRLDFALIELPNTSVNNVVNGVATTQIAPHQGVVLRREEQGKHVRSWSVRGNVLPGE
jgi:hypothetical protein